MYKFLKYVLPASIMIYTLVATPVKEYKFNFKKIEKNIFKEMNLARRNPQKYVKKLEDLKKLYDGDILRIPNETPIKTREGLSAVNEAISSLKQKSSVLPLKYNKSLREVALKYAKEQGRDGSFGHYGKDGSTPAKRVSKKGKWTKTVGESIAYGAHTGEMVVMQLIIDDGVPSRSHRESMYNSEFRITGVGCTSHKILRIGCVILYAYDFEKK